MNLLNTLSISKLKQAITIKEQIAKLEQALSSLMGSAATTAKVTVTPTPAPKKGMSAAGRSRVAAAQKIRWAKIKAASSAASAKVAKVAKAVPAAKPAKKKWKISAAGMAKIRATSKAYWAKRKAAEKLKLESGSAA